MCNWLNSEEMSVSLQGSVLGTVLLSRFVRVNCIHIQFADDPKLEEADSSGGQDYSGPQTEYGSTMGCYCNKKKGDVICKTQEVIILLAQG